MAQFTKAAIVSSFIELLNERPFDKISVADITQQAIQLPASDAQSPPEPLGMMATLRMTRSPSSMRGCAYSGLTACAWSMPRSCRSWSAATPTRRP